MSIKFEVTTTLNVKPQKVYAAWLDSEKHSKMTGSPAKVSDVEGEAFSAWDGYINGRNITLEAGKRIIQSWRTSEFSVEEADSQIEVLFAAEGDGTKITLLHTRLPPHGTQYQQGWEESYFIPMRDFFGPA
ncbi:MAG: SRPBCC domain-containing protein [Chloroflexota bacterium]